MDSIIHGDKKLSKLARKEAENSTCLHSDSFEINTGKSQRNESVLVAQLWEKLSSLESYQKIFQTYKRRSYHREWSSFNTTQKMYNTKK